MPTPDALAEMAAWIDARTHTYTDACRETWDCGRLEDHEVHQTSARIRARAARPPCPTCSGPSRETKGLVCQTCGTDYGSPVHAPPPWGVAPALLADLYSLGREYGPASVALAAVQVAVDGEAHAVRQELAEAHGRIAELEQAWPLVLALRAAGWLAPPAQD